MRFRVSEFRNSLYTMPPVDKVLCRTHKGRLLHAFEPEWESLNEGLPFHLRHYGECICLEPTAYDRRIIADAHRLEAEYKLELERFKLAETFRSRKETAKAVEVTGRWYLITFTQPDTSDDPKGLLKRTEKVIKSKMVAAKHWCYTLELTEKGIPHTHIRLYSEKYFDYAKVKNLNGGYIAHIAREDWGSGKYIVKKESKPSDDWLKAKALPGWLWCSDEYWHTTGAVPPS